MSSAQASLPRRDCHPTRGWRPHVIRGQLERLLERIPAAWIFAWLYNGFIPHHKLMKSIELFYTKVLPRVGDR